MTDLESVYRLIWLKTGTVKRAAMITINSVLVNKIQFVSIAAWNWDGMTVEVSVYTIPALMLGMPIFWTELSI